MKKIYFLTGLLLLLPAIFFAGCSKTMSPEEIYARYSPGVVLLYNDFYYSAELSDGRTVYFNVINDGEGAVPYFTDKYEDKKIIANQANRIYTTGIFTDDEGGVLTSSAILPYKLSLEDVQEAYKKAMWFQDSYLSRDPSVHGIYPTPESFRPVSHIRVVLKGQPLGRDEDLEAAQTEREEVQAPDKPLTLLRLKSRETPSEAFDFEKILKKKKLPEVQAGTPLYMIAYNPASNFAYQGQDILPESALLQGKATQEINQRFLLHDIGAYFSSCGAPIVNDKGQLLALNLAVTTPEGKVAVKGASIAQILGYLDAEFKSDAYPEAPAADAMGFATEPKLPVQEAKKAYQYYWDVYLSFPYDRMPTILAHHISEFEALKNTTAQKVEKEIKDYALLWSGVKYDMEEFTESDGTNRFYCEGIYVAHEGEGYIGAEERTFKTKTNLGFVVIDGHPLLNYHKQNATIIKRSGGFDW